MKNNNRYVLLGIVLVLLSLTLVPRNVYSWDDDDDYFDARNFYNLQDQIRDFYDDGDYDEDYYDRYYYRHYDDGCYYDRDCWDDDDRCDDDDYYRYDCDRDYDYDDNDKYTHKEKYEYDKDIDIKDNYNREKKLTFEIENFYDYSGNKLDDAEIKMYNDDKKND